MLVGVEMNNPVPNIRLGRVTIVYEGVGVNRIAVYRLSRVEVEAVSKVPGSAENFIIILLYFMFVDA